MNLPEIDVQNDYDGYFERLVQKWVNEKAASGEPFKHTRISISAGPYRPMAVTAREIGSTLFLDFYSALRNGFGSLTPGEIDGIKEWL